MSTEEKQDEIQVSSEKKPEETPSEEVESDDDNASSESESESENEETADESSSSSSKKKEKKEKKPKKSRLHRSKRENKEKEKEKKSKDETKDKKHKKIPSLFNMFSSLLTNIFSDKKAKAVESKRLKDWRESTAEIFARPTANLPIHKDLPRLAKKVIFVDRRTSADTLPGDTISPLKNTADAPVSVYDAVGDFLWKAGFLLCGGREGAEKIRGGYDDVIKEDIALDVQSETLKQFISGLGEDHPVGRLLKGVNQSITAPANIEIHTKILQKLLFKDSQKKPWNVFVHVWDDGVTVEHVRVQTNLNQLDVDSAFEFTLVTRFMLNKELTKIVGADVFISEYEFGENTLPEKKESLAKLFDAAPKPSQTKGFDAPPKSMAKVGVNIVSKK